MVQKLAEEVEYLKKKILDQQNSNKKSSIEFERKKNNHHSSHKLIQNGILYLNKFFKHKSKIKSRIFAIFFTLNIKLWNWKDPRPVITSSQTSLNILSEENSKRNKHQKVHKKNNFLEVINEQKPCKNSNNNHQQKYVVLQEPNKNKNNKNTLKSSKEFIESSGKKFVLMKNENENEKFSNKCFYLINQPNNSNDFEGYFSDAHEIECSKLRRSNFNYLDKSASSSDSTLTQGSSTSSTCLDDNNHKIQESNCFVAKSNLVHSKLRGYSVSNLTNINKKIYFQDGTFFLFIRTIVSFIRIVLMNINY